MQTGAHSIACVYGAMEAETQTGERVNLRYWSIIGADGREVAGGFALADSTDGPERYQAQ